MKRFVIFAAAIVVSAVHAGDAVQATRPAVLANRKLSNNERRELDARLKKATIRQDNARPGVGDLSDTAISKMPESKEKQALRRMQDRIASARDGTQVLKSAVVMVEFGQLSLVPAKCRIGIGHLARSVDPTGVLAPQKQTSGGRAVRSQAFESVFRRDLWYEAGQGIKLIPKIIGDVYAGDPDEAVAILDEADKVLNRFVIQAGAMGFRDDQRKVCTSIAALWLERVKMGGLSQLQIDRAWRWFDLAEGASPGFLSKEERINLSRFAPSSQASPEERSDWQENR